jgi:manganese/zinc/iron transport system substrate-binding protein
MRIKSAILCGLALLFIITFYGCFFPAAQKEAAGGKLKIVATTTMLADLCAQIGGDKADVDSLMGPGIDPHLYQASAGDMQLMQQADLVVYNGLHLEGKMGELFGALSGRGQQVVCVADGIDKGALLAWEDGGSIYDPHIWFNVSLWKQAAAAVAKALSEADAQNAGNYRENLAAYLEELEETDRYVREKAALLPKDARVLVTAHDAFQYFGKAYGFEVRGLQGISTDTEAGTGDISALADEIVFRRIKAVFLESSVPPKTIEALQAAVEARGFDVKIGGALYSDSLGSEGTGAEDYIKMVRYNIDTIADALQ